VRVGDFLFPRVAVFLDSFLAFLVGMNEGFLLLKGLNCGIFAFHQCEVGALGELKFSRIRSHIIRASIVHRL